MEINFIGYYAERICDRGAIKGLLSALVAPMLMFINAEGWLLKIIVWLFLLDLVTGLVKAKLGKSDKGPKIQSKALFHTIVKFIFYSALIFMGHLMQIACSFSGFMLFFKAYIILTETISIIENAQALGVKNVPDVKKLQVLYKKHFGEGEKPASGPGYKKNDNAGETPVSRPLDQARNNMDAQDAQGINE